MRVRWTSRPARTLHEGRSPPSHLLSFFPRRSRVGARAEAWLRLHLHFLLAIGTPSGAQPCDLRCPVDWWARPWPGGPARFYSWHPPGRPSLCPTVYSAPFLHPKMRTRRAAHTNALPVHVRSNYPTPLPPRPGQLAHAKIPSSGLGSASIGASLTCPEHASFQDKAEGDSVSCQGRTWPPRHDDLTHFWYRTVQNLTPEFNGCHHANTDEGKGGQVAQPPPGCMPLEGISS